MQKIIHSEIVLVAILQITKRSNNSKRETGIFTWIGIGLFSLDLN